MSSISTIYDAYHAQCPFDNFGETTFHADKAVAAYPDAGSALDFGCGNGVAVRRMRSAGYEWYGLEGSSVAFDKYLLGPPFFVGETSQFAPGQFDLLYSTEVLEHVETDDVPQVVADLCRITRRYMFLTISLRPSSDDNRYHGTLRPRRWWEELFAEHDFLVDQPVINQFQRVTLKSTRKILSKWSHLGPKCRAFAENPPYELSGQTQFWFFAFRRVGVPPAPLPAPTQSLARRRLVPALRRILRLDHAER